MSANLNSNRIFDAIVAEILSDTVTCHCPWCIVLLHCLIIHFLSLELQGDAFSPTMNLDDLRSLLAIQQVENEFDNLLFCHFGSHECDDEH